VCMLPPLHTDIGLTHITPQKTHRLGKKRKSVKQVQPLICRSDLSILYHKCCSSKIVSDYIGFFVERMKTCSMIANKPWMRCQSGQILVLANNILFDKNKGTFSQTKVDKKGLIISSRIL